MNQDKELDALMRAKVIGKTIKEVLVADGIIGFLFTDFTFAHFTFEPDGWKAVFGTMEVQPVDPVKEVVQ